MISLKAMHFKPNMSAKSQANNTFPLSDEQVASLTNWIQLVQMQEDMVTEEDVIRQVNEICDKER